MINNSDDRYEVMAIVIGYAMARCENAVREIMGVRHQKRIFEQGVAAVQGKRTFGYLKNLRDEFDPYFPNGRVGWIGRSLPENRRIVFDILKNSGEDDVAEAVREILTGSGGRFFDAVLDEFRMIRRAGLPVPTPKMLDKSVVQKECGKAGSRQEPELPDLAEVIGITELQRPGEIGFEVVLTDEFRQEFSKVAGPGCSVKYLPHTTLVSAGPAGTLYVPNQSFVLTLAGTGLVSSLKHYREALREVLQESGHADLVAKAETLRRLEGSDVSAEFEDAYVGLYGEGGSRLGMSRLWEFATCYGSWYGRESMFDERFLVPPVVSALDLHEDYGRLIAGLADICSESSVILGVCADGDCAGRLWLAD